MSNSKSSIEREESSRCCGTRSSQSFVEELKQYKKTSREYPTDFHVVQTYVQRAVQTKHELMVANCSTDKDALLQGYDSICDQLKSKEEPSMLHKLLLALAYGETLGYLTSYPQFHAKLLHLIMKLDPFAPPRARQHQGNDVLVSTSQASLFTDYVIADAHLALCLAIISANSTFAVPVLQTMVRFLANQNTICAGQPCDTGRMLRVHSTIYHILILVPKALPLLPPIFAKHFPFKLKQQEVISGYVCQLLQVLHYAPSLFADIYELCIRHALQIDVEIRIRDDGNVSMEPIKQDEDEPAIFNMDGKNGDGDNDTNNRNDATTKADEMADKLDAIMLLMFEHVVSVCRTRLDYVETYAILLRIFDSYILATHKSKFVQFLMLFICGKYQSFNLLNHPSEDRSEPLYRDFASNLLCKILDTRQANVHRQMSACYLASFISRAEYVDSKTACESIAVLLQWANLYIAQFGRSSSSRTVAGGNMCATHALFYTVCQAAFYIMCFRGADAFLHYDNTISKLARQHIDEEAEDNNDKSVVDVDTNIVDIGPQRWLQVCSHPQLQPLKYCLESVRREFLHVAKILQLLPSEFVRVSLMQENMKAHQHLSRARRTSSSIQTAAVLEMKRKSGGVGGLGQGSNPLDSFFPFDPYLLCKSHMFVEPFYKSWVGSCDQLDDNISLEFDTGDLGDESSTESDSSNDSDNLSIAAENDFSPRSLDAQSNVEMISCSFAEEIQSFRKHSISSGGSW